MTLPVDNAVQRLVEARRSRQAAPVVPVADESAAYAIQARVSEALGLVQSPARYWKSGGASVDTQTHAPLPDAGVWPSPADASRWPFFGPGVEAEVALRLKAEVTPALAATLDDEACRALVGAMTVTIEIVDSRWREGPDAPALAKLADFQSHGALIIGAWLDYDAARDWSRETLEVRIGHAPVATFTGSHSMVDPIRVLPAWLRHATRDGATVPAGTVVTTGSWCGLLPARIGDRVEVSSARLGSVVVQL